MLYTGDFADTDRNVSRVKLAMGEITGLWNEEVFCLITH